MNERIRLLAEQAGIAVWGDAVYMYDPKDTLDSTVMAKFAELIVRECADICINKNVSNLDLDVIRESGKFTLQDLATKSCGENLSKQIREHFGVIL